jgi:fibronectin type 3 domain-containing protein
VFPPASPEGLEAVFSGPGQKPFVDLVWTPDTDADLSGYNVYRAEAGNDLEPKKLNTDLVKSPAFRDEGAGPGHKYTYSVSAVDARGNESAHSQSAEEAVPAQ